MPVLALFLAGILAAAPVFADTATVHSASIEAAAEHVQVKPRQSFLTKKERNFGMNWAIVATPQPEGQTKIEISAVALGRGADFRKWLPERTELVDKAGRIIRPVKESKIYVPKGSKLAPVAPWLVAATVIDDDHLGEAVGMGLLASAGKGELEGCKYTFLTGAPLAELQLKTAVRHKDTNQLVTAATPVVLDTD